MKEEGFVHLSQSMARNSVLRKQVGIKQRSHDTQSSFHSTLYDIHTLHAEKERTVFGLSLRTIISALRPASPGEKCRTFLCMESPESVIRSENVLSATKRDQELLKSTGEFLKRNLCSAEVR
ncbi:hypothetical protein CEXT_732861 [Caerostris extrusa]|uniref:Uncharacterized protein n=1 Tax=Caerostris extrusa TaxID=172846 RepID=A0AAV4R1K7_CAEEX|nr:hypothetical protein CEXT_732861 [Caerostris extrusa]